MIEKIRVIELKKYSLENGDLLKGITCSEIDNGSFGELYFSFINLDSIKAWKKHKAMYMNLFVPVGNVKFVFFCEKKSTFKIEEIGENNEKRIYVPPNIWFGFKGLDKKNLVVNLASIPHDDNEVEKLNIKTDKIKFEW